MSARYTQSKSEAAKHTEILKAMLKRPENKLCADCKRNDPRWASTNLGCFMCIRCSGIHRGMGVHITRIKSIDLDTWSPEQIANVQRWGNRRANAYWEAHLKPGHMPPEHKIESFIRSKYETKRWAMEGPLPEPESLDTEDSAAPPSSADAPAPPPVQQSQRPKPSAIDLLAAPPRSSSSSPSTTSAPRAAAAAPAAAPPPVASGGGGGLFDLDFSSPAPGAQAAPVARKDAKADILSLFASAPPPRPQQQQQQQQTQSISTPGHDLFGGMAGLNLGGGGGGAGASDPWGAPVQAQHHQAPVQQQQQQQFGAFGGASSGGSGGWGNFESSHSTPAPAQASRPSTDLFSSSSAAQSSNPWGSSAPSSDPFGDFSSGGGGGGSSSGQGQKKQPDAFSDIWA